MSSTLHRLIYISQNQIEGSEQDIHREIESILRLARNANTAAGITGALMFNTGCFAQILEGTQQNIEETFERIQCDPRHDSVVVLAFDVIEARGFDNWSMAYVGYDTNALEEYSAIKAQSGFKPEQIPSENIFTLLQEHLIDAENNNSAQAA